MLVHVLSLLTVVMAVGQTSPQESALLRQVPAEADVVVRVRDLGSTRADLDAMIRAMSPALGEQAGPVLEQGIAAFAQTFGEEATKVSFLTLMRGLAPQERGKPIFAVIVPEADEAAVLKGLNKGQAPQLKALEGYRSFAGPDGDTVFVTSGSAFTAFGTDEALVKAIAAKPEGALEKRLQGPLKESFLRGDLGAYVNIGVLAERYEGQIAAAREQFMAALDQAGQQAGNADMMGMVKNIYGGLFEVVKDGDILTLSIDFAKEGLAVDGVVTAKPGSGAAKTLAEMKGTTAEGLGRLPADAGYYVYMNLDAALMQRLQNLSMSMLLPGQKVSPELEKATAALAEQGKVSSFGATTLTAEGLRALNVAEVSDPAKYLEAVRTMMSAMKPAGEAGASSLIKEIKFAPSAETYKGFVFDRVEMKLDFDKLGGEGNPSVASIRGMFGGDTSTVFMGTDGKVVVSINAPSFDLAKPMLDAYLSDASTVGQVASFQSVRKALPEEVNILGLMSAQGLVRQITSQLSTVPNQPALKPPADMPVEPVFLGGALAPVEGGVRFKFVLPSAAGPVFEKGMMPIIRALQGRVDQ